MSNVCFLALLPGRLARLILGDLQNKSLSLRLHLALCTWCCSAVDNDTFRSKTAPFDDSNKTLVIPQDALYLFVSPRWSESSNLTRQSSETFNCVIEGVGSKQSGVVGFRCTFIKRPRVPRTVGNDWGMTATARVGRFSVFLEKSGGGQSGRSHVIHEETRKHFFLKLWAFRLHKKKKN